MTSELLSSSKILLALIHEQQDQLLAGQPIRPDAHKLSEAALLLAKVMRSLPPSTTLPMNPGLNSAEESALEAGMDITEDGEDMVVEYDLEKA